MRLKRPKTLMKTEAFENDAETSVLYCHFHQRFERFRPWVTALVRFSKNPLSSQRKRSKTFSTTLVFSFCFHLSTLIPFHSKTHTFDRLPPIVHAKTPDTRMETNVHDAFLRIVFKRCCFHLPTLETERFQNVFSKGSVVLVWTIDKNASQSMPFHTKTHSRACGQVKTNRKASVGENILLRFRRDVKNALVWSAH